MAAPPGLPARLARWGLAGLGVVSVGVAAAGVILPGLPTTIFLIIAVWCFTKSCPWLEQRLVRNRLFAPFLVYLDRTEPIPLRAKVAAIATMWAFVAGAVVLFTLRPASPAWLAPLVACAACVGTVTIARWDKPAGDR